MRVIAAITQPVEVFLHESQSLGQDELHRKPPHGALETPATMACAVASCSVEGAAAKRNIALRGASSETQ
jgi:hypothetical protein